MPLLSLLLSLFAVPHRFSPPRVQGSATYPFAVNEHPPSGNATCDSQVFLTMCCGDMRSLLSRCMLHR